LSVVGQVLLGLAEYAAYPAPLPQSNAYWKPAAVSAEDGSCGLVSVSVKLEPSLTGPLFSKVAVGGTLLTVTVAVYSRSPPSLSLILPLTERVPLSFVGHVALLLVP
jgi:hypothetical protein